MKRYNGLHDKLCTIENIEVSDDNARKNKNKKYGINKHDKNRQYENEDLVDKLFNLKYKTSKYSLYKIMAKLIMLIVEIKLYFILYIDLIIFLLILKLLNMIGVFILKIEKKILNLKYNILWLKINLKMILLELYAV